MDKAPTGFPGEEHTAPKQTPEAQNKVLLFKRQDYSPKSLNSAVEEVFSRVGKGLLQPGSRVLLKVNLVMGYASERCVTTHPAVVRAVARLVLDAGAHPVIADSPGFGNFERAARKAGFMDIAGELGIPCVELTDPVPLPTPSGAPFHKIEVARRIVESDLIINLPKMKTHAQMLLSLGVKNLFGCVVAQRKAEWHYSVGMRREVFAGVLLAVWQAVRPALTVLDGIQGMDGFGPSNGNPCPYHVLGGARDALKMDFWLCRMLGLRLADFPLWQAAFAQGLPQCELDDSDLSGDFSADHVWSGVHIPKLDSLGVIPALSGLPFGKVLERALASRPVHRPMACTGCGQCVAVCPAKAMTLRGKAMVFDYNACIRCYCCQEMCPSNAIGFKDGLLRKMLKLLGR